MYANARGVIPTRVATVAALPVLAAGALLQSVALSAVAALVYLHVVGTLRALSKERRRITRALLTDVTGLGNKRAFGRVRAAVDDDPHLVWLAFDADTFKRLNDLDEDEGDRALQFFASIIRHALSVSGISVRVPRRGLRAFRHGGDEYSVFVPAESAEIVLQTVERLSRYTFDSVTTRLSGAIGATYSEASKKLHDLKEARRRLDPSLRRPELGPDAKSTDGGRP